MYVFHCLKMDNIGNQNEEFWQNYWQNTSTGIYQVELQTKEIIFVECRHPVEVSLEHARVIDLVSSHPENGVSNFSKIQFFLGQVWAKGEILRKFFVAIILTTTGFIVIAIYVSYSPYIFKVISAAVDQSLMLNSFFSFLCKCLNQPNPKSLSDGLTTKLANFHFPQLQMTQIFACIVVPFLLSKFRVTAQTSFFAAVVLNFLLFNKNWSNKN